MYCVRSALYYRDYRKRAFGVKRGSQKNPEIFRNSRKTFSCHRGVRTHQIVSVFYARFSIRQAPPPGKTRTILVFELLNTAVLPNLPNEGISFAKGKGRLIVFPASQCRRYSHQPIWAATRARLVARRRRRLLGIGSR